MTLELPNYTLIIQFFLFMGTLCVLNKFVFSPVLQVIDERRKKTKEAVKEARVLSIEAEKKTDEYEHKIKAHRGVLKEMRDNARKEMAEQSSVRVDESRSEFLQAMQKTKKSVANQMSKAETALAKDIKELSEDIYSKFSKKV